MASSLNPHSRKNSIKTENTAGTMNRTIGDIQTSINDQFNAGIRTFMVNKYPGRKMKLKLTRQREKEISNRWRTPT